MGWKVRELSYIWENSNIVHRFAINPQCLGSASETVVMLSDESQIMVNPFFRYSDIFSDRVFSGSEIDPELVNIIMHYLANSDRSYGDALINVRLNCIDEEICDGIYGESVKSDYALLSALHKRMITQFLACYNQSGERLELFNEAFFAFFGRLDLSVTDAEQYDDNFTRHSAEIIFSRSRNTYYCYCAAPENDYHTALFRLLQNLFADCTLTIIPVWGTYNFGIVGNDDTTRSTVPVVGQMQII